MLKVFNTFYPSLNLDANPEYNDDIEPDFDNIEVTAKLGSTNDDETEFQIMVIVSVDSDGSEGIPYSFSIVGVAHFGCSIENKEERITKAAHNGAGIVYAGIREQLAIMSSRSAFGVVTLPTYYFSPKDFEEPESKNN